jgi:hypothetical protein
MWIIINIINFVSIFLMMFLVGVLLNVFLMLIRGRR